MSILLHYPLPVTIFYKQTAVCYCYEYNLVNVDKCLNYISYFVVNLQ